MDNEKIIEELKKIIAEIEQIRSEEKMLIVLGVQVWNMQTKLSTSIFQNLNSKGEKQWNR